MATFAIGDVQGCYRELTLLLRKVRFRPDRDRLWFTGDLVNRGPRSLEVLRFVCGLGDGGITVLGNHDLHLLACAATGKTRRKDTFHDVLAARDRDRLLDWLRMQPLLHHERALGYTMVHAGLPPQWTVREARVRAREVERVLRGDRPERFYAHMYGERPRRWSPDLSGWPRLRFITNALTRIRYCKTDGTIAMGDKGPPGSQADGYHPWYEVGDRRSARSRIVFGHWATLHLAAAEPHRRGVFGLDTGCVWGRELTAMRLEDGRKFNVQSKTRAPLRR
jgi:bis(5'-nucleosyl)-tetraphosphatase (symmetrical)